MGAYSPFCLTENEKFSQNFHTKDTKEEKITKEEGGGKKGFIG